MARKIILYTILTAGYIWLIIIYMSNFILIFYLEPYEYDKECKVLRTVKKNGKTTIWKNLEPFSFETLLLGRKKYDALKNE